MQQYLRAGLVDEMHLALSPVLIGSGERLFEGLDAPRLGYRVSDSRSSPAATHVMIRRDDEVASRGKT
jgi:dihydrofolate reductase